jgi:hypothetical protein
MIVFLLPGSDRHIFRQTPALNLTRITTSIYLIEKTAS